MCIWLIKLTLICKIVDIFKIKDRIYMNLQINISQLTNIFVKYIS